MMIFLLFKKIPQIPERGRIIEKVKYSTRYIERLFLFHEKTVFLISFMAGFFVSDRVLYACIYMYIHTHVYTYIYLYMYIQM